MSDFHNEAKAILDRIDCFLTEANQYIINNNHRDKTRLLKSISSTIDSLQKANLPIPDELRKLKLQLIKDLHEVETVKQVLLDFAKDLVLTLEKHGFALNPRRKQRSKQRNSTSERGLLEC